MPRYAAISSWPTRASIQSKGNTTTQVSTEVIAKAAVAVHFPKSERNRRYSGQLEYARMAAHAIVERNGAITTKQAKTVSATRIASNTRLTINFSRSEGMSPGCMD